LANDLPFNAGTPAKISLLTSNKACSMDDIIDCGLLNRAADTFIACDHLEDSHSSAEQSGQLLNTTIFNKENL
jgi:hypothetical protein